jgi:hypothetical protein
VIPTHATSNIEKRYGIRSALKCSSSAVNKNERMPLEVRIILTVVSDKIDHRQELSHSLVASPAGNLIAVISTSSLIHQRIRGLKVELNPTSRTSYCRPASVSKSLDQTLQTAMPVAMWIDRIRIQLQISQQGFPLSPATMSKMNPSTANPEKATDKERDLNREERGRGTQKGQVDKQHQWNETKQPKSDAKVDKSSQQGHGIGEHVKHSEGAGTSASAGRGASAGGAPAGAP